MREILFKGKRIDNGEWVEGLLWKKKYDTPKMFISCFPDKDDYEEKYVVDKNSICQYTGLTDKNGNKIWEGDILQNENFEWNGYVVEHHGDWRIWSCGDYDEDDFLWNWCSERYMRGRGRYIPTEVIGNIFDNPELLRGDE